jgi:hypothetical protein
VTRGVRAEIDIDSLSQVWGPELGSDKKTVPRPEIFSADQLLALSIPAPEMLIERLLPKNGAILCNGATKSGKTILATQKGIAVASGSPLFGFYRVLQPGAVLMIEQDDPGATASIRQILLRSPIATKGIPFYLVPKVSFTFGPDFLKWLQDQIAQLSIRFVILDSFTALRGSRARGVDIVKAEQDDLAQLDDLAKRTACALEILHHTTASKSSMDWTLQAAGTFAMTAATEAQVHLSRFPDLDGAPERLVRIRGRHCEDLEMVLRFRKDTLDYEHILEGGAATAYPLLLELRSAFGEQSFSPKDLSHSLGISIRSAHRQLDRLYRADAVTRPGHGKYALKGVAE